MKRESLFVWLLRFINGWVIVGAIVVMIAIGLFWAFVLWALAPSGPKVIVPAAEITIIPAPTITPVQAKTPTNAPSPEPQEIDTATLLPGSLVEVMGTGNDGLRIRSEPGIQGTILYVVKDGQRFIIKDGPKEADGYTWYYVVSEENKNIKGWGASSYLQVVPEP